jgi:hypothetical protein
MIRLDTIDGDNDDDIDDHVLNVPLNGRAWNDPIDDDDDGDTDGLVAKGMG